ncbi:hypothetical protein Pint_17596 [Pistacia integerrima]|uniref:Uncharacterized protein n=1 Tax=Pistacia integerrima TaxID=434235 RepID=A0ACC0YUK1_9ROSI|nr:hypothetical protein Pint_17596 [Pistacia integerrima]
MIKVLFEQYKDYKRYSYMIANALDGEKRFTAAQVSRKLKQLGLRPPQQKRSEAQMHLRDEGLNDSSTVEAHDSDKETLLSLTNKRKSNDGGGRFFGEGSQEKDMQGKLSDDFDDETLTSVFKSSLSSLVGHRKSRKLHSKPTDDRLETIQVEKTNEDAGNGGTTDAMGSFAPVNNADDLPHLLMDDELADSGYDVAAGEILSSAVSRRKLRMVIDPEDED